MAGTQRWGLTLPLHGLSLAEQREIITALPVLGYTDAWSAELNGVDAFTPLTLASQWAPQLRLGTAIAGIYTRAPVALAISAATLGSAGARPVRHGHRHLVPGRGRAVERHPVREALPAGPGHAAVPARGAGRARRSASDYETFSVHGFRLDPAPEVPPALALAALRPGMVRLAAKEADAAITNWLAPADVPRVREVAGRGLRAGRPDLRLPDRPTPTWPGTSAAGCWPPT